MASANTLFKSHEDYRRNKELEEARKAGIAPAELDEEGKEINPHIPQYMSSAPWYLNSERPSLKHQKDWREGPKDDRRFYDRGAKTFQAKTFRKDACENCGALTHKTKDCVERPRARGAKWTKKHIAADEKIEEISLESFDAKRDRWNGYDAAEYSRVVDLYDKLEEAKKQARKKAELEQRFGEGGAAPQDKGAAGSDSDVDDEDKITEAEEAGFGKVEKRVRTTAGGASGSVRNLRIREDTAKYLLNLDLSSAHYDPKSRSMREDPQPNKAPHEKAFLGDNFTRHSGDFHNFQALSMHAINAQDKGQAIHPQGAPSQAEALHVQFKAKKELLQHKDKNAIKNKYGDAAAHADADEERLLLGQTEAYVEYNAQGRVIKGQETKARSRYEEDARINNHTSIFGSWWSDGVWGYTCCHQTVKNSYCTGSAGEQAQKDTLAQMQENMAAKADQPPTAPETARKGNAAEWGTDAGEVDLDKEKLATALQRHAAMARAAQGLDERKRKYNSLAGEEELGAEEMEAYRIKKARAEDPMADLQGDKQGYAYV